MTEEDWEPSWETTRSSDKTENSGMPGKITIFKKVYWKSGGRELSGKVKQILSDHVVVKRDDGEYIVHKSALSTKSEKRS